MLLLPHDAFYGSLHLKRALPGITCSHRLANAPPEEVELHTHIDAHFVLVTGGRYVSSARLVAASGATLIYNPPGTTHRDHFVEGRGSFFTVAISNDWLTQSAPKSLSSAPVHVGNHRACGLSRALVMECGRWTTASELRLESLTLELLSACSEHDRRERLQPSWLSRAIDFVSDTTRERLTVGVIARAVGVHPTHLARVFREFAGCTPGDLLRARRLDRAASLLLETKQPIARIALDCGFADQPQLTRAFRRNFGVPPAVFRAGSVRNRAMLRFDKTRAARTRRHMR
jgi:AraC family transcriptional regulator